MEPLRPLFSDFVVTFRCKSSEFPRFFFCKLLACNYLVRLEGIEPSWDEIYNSLQIMANKFHSTISDKGML